MSENSWTIYTDGSSQGKRIQYKDGWLCERGGYASIIVRGGTVVKKLYQGFKRTTNNRCELFGVLEGLKYFKTPQTITIYSDSQYIVNNINSGNVFKWFEENDYSKKNLDIWYEIVDLLSFHKVTFVWVKGHASNEMNNLADMYAQHSANCMNLLEDIKDDS